MPRVLFLVSIGAVVLLGAPAWAADRVLHVMVFDPTGLTEAWATTQGLAREFEAEHPGVRVQLLSEGSGDVLAKLKIMLAARQPLDVAAIDVVEFSSFLDDGLLLDLQPYFDADDTWKPEEYFKDSGYLETRRVLQGFGRRVP